MSLLTPVRLTERICHLIETKATGNPDQFAEKLEIGRRRLLQLLAELKDEGLPIKYCEHRHCYFFEKDVFCSFKMHVMEDDGKNKIIGGENILHFFDAVQYYCTGGDDLCAKLMSKEERKYAGNSYSPLY